jgi:lysophospholipase L1-like esterase
VRRRTIVIAVVALVLAPVVLLAVQVQLARTGPRLDDEVGFRPVRLTVREGPEPVHVVWLGDSTASGVGAGELVDTMAHRVTADVVDGPVVLSILAVSGADVGEVIEDQLPLLAQLDDVDRVFVSAGANDVTGLARRVSFRDEYRRLLAAIDEVAAGAGTVAIGIPDIGTAPRIPVPLRDIAGFWAGELDGVIAEVTAERGVPHVDLAGRTGPAFAEHPDLLFSLDEYHPNGAGHDVWADAVLDALSIASDP